MQKAVASQFTRSLYLYQLLRTPAPKWVKVLNRLKGQKDFPPTPGPEMPHQAQILCIHSFQRERRLRCLGGLGESHRLPRGSSQALKHLQIRLASPYPNIISHRASASLHASLVHPDGAAQTLTAAKHRATGQQERLLLLEACVAQDRAVNP